MTDKLQLLVLPALAVVAGPKPANLEDPLLWGLMMVFGLTGSLFYNRRKLTTRQEWFEAALAGVIAPALIGLTYGLFGQWFADQTGVTLGRMVLVCASGILAALGVERWLTRLDNALKQRVEESTGHTLEETHENDS